jgi:hypothetical protein
MLSRRGVVFGSMLLAASVGGARAADQSAQDFLARIYAAYKGKNAKGISINTRAKLARYFTPALARLIDADARSVQPGDMGVLGSDPFIDAQDFEIAAFAIEVKELGDGKALGTVKFKNIDEDQTISLDLIKLKTGWRIDEIRGPSNKSLRALLKKP